MSGPALLEVRDVSRRFPGRRGGTVRAVDGVSFDVAVGEALGVVGETGCGKTTLARLALRLLEPTAGSVLFAGEDITRARARRLKAVRREMQMVFQDPYGSLNPRRSVGAILAEPFAVHGLHSGRADRRRAVAELMDLVGLGPEHHNRFPHEFSGGQRQRIAVARAIALRPRLLVADEPVSALDASTQAEVLNLLRDLRRRLDLTLVLIAHDLSVVRHLCDRVAVMHGGRLVELAETDALFAQPQHPYTAALLAAIPVLPTGARPRAGEPPAPQPVSPASSASGSLSS